MGLSFTKRESKLQNEILIYKTGLLDYKWDSRVAIHQHEISPFLFYCNMDILALKLQFITF